MSKRRVLVVGAGLVGLATAIAAAQRGWDVAVLERGDTSAEASWAAGGMLAAQNESTAQNALWPLCRLGTRSTRNWVEMLREEAGLDPALQTSGLLHVAQTEDELTALQNQYAWQLDAGATYRLCSRREVRARVPKISTDIVGGLFFQDDHHLDPRLYAASMSAWLRQRNIPIYSHRHVEKLLIENNRCLGIVVNHVPDAQSSNASNGSTRTNNIFYADDVILCAGAWSGLFATGILDESDLFPIKGQIVQLAAPMGLLPCVLHGAGGYLIPRQDGRILCGATVEKMGFDKTVKAGSMVQLLDMAITLLPDLAHYPITSQWSGLRPATVDGLPFLGASSVENLWLNTGHYRNGVLLASISAELVTADMAGIPTELSLDAFSPRRLSARGAVSAPVSAPASVSVPVSAPVSVRVSG